MKALQNGLLNKSFVITKGMGLYYNSMPYFKLFNGGKQEVKNKFNQIHLRKGQIKEYEDICRSVEFDDGFLQ